MISTQRRKPTPIMRLQLLVTILLNAIACLVERQPSNQIKGPGPPTWVHRCLLVAICSLRRRRAPVSREHVLKSVRRTMLPSTTLHSAGNDRPAHGLPVLYFRPHFIAGCKQGKLPSTFDTPAHTAILLLLTIVSLSANRKNESACSYRRCLVLVRRQRHCFRDHGLCWGQLR